MFVTFSATHWLTLFALAAIMALSVRELRIRGEMRSARVILALHVAGSLLAYPLALLAKSTVDLPLRTDDIVPLHLCNIAAVCGAFALLRRSQLLAEITWYFGLAGTLQGLITPALVFDFPHPVFFTFFLLHGVVVSTALVLAFGLDWQPRRPLRRTILRMFLLINLYLAGAFAANSALGTNFGFVSAKPDTASLLDALPAWPWYLLVLEGLALALFALASLPFLRRAAANARASSEMSE